MEAIVIKKTALIKSPLLPISLIVLAMTNIFFAGYFSSDKPLESVANYASKVVVQNTVNKKYCALTVQSTNDSGSIADSYNEFHTLYGLFKQTKVTFASAINLYNAGLNSKDHDIRIKYDESLLSDNLSMFYLGPVGSIEYEGHYKHYVYPLETMFVDDQKKYDVVPNKYVAYISQNHADKILEQYGEQRDADGNYNRDINIDSTAYQFAILNIYYQSNYYYEGISEILDDFIAISYYAPSNLGRERKNIYFLSEYSYQNEYFMKYVSDVYANGKFNVEINHNNIVGSIDDVLLTSFYYQNLTNQYTWAVVLLLFLSFAIIGCALFFAHRAKLFKSNLYIVAALLLCLLPYILFRLIYNYSFSVGFFTYFSCKTFFITLSVLAIILFAQKYIPVALKKRSDSSGDSHHEIDI